MGPEACDRPSKHRSRAHAFADFASRVSSQRSTGRFAHELERRANLLIRDQAQEGRLLQLNDESLAQSVVEGGIAGFVNEVGDDHHVMVGQLCFGGTDG